MVGKVKVGNKKISWLGKDSVREEGTTVRNRKRAITKKVVR